MGTLAVQREAVGRYCEKSSPRPFHWIISELTEMETARRGAKCRYAPRYYEATYRCYDCLRAPGCVDAENAARFPRTSYVNEGSSARRDEAVRTKNGLLSRWETLADC